ncbi:MAG TPA: DUF4328 domain-containing protein [Acidimicrobiales bacterium]|nr:DUF4328 domain-containing protein [Acidimicrobiales bacterium]
MTASPLPGPGWHPDPGHPLYWRWWDGSTWTAHVAPMASPFARSPADLLAAEEVMGPWARLAVVVYPVIAFANGVGGWFNAPRYAAYFHSLRLAIDHAQNGNTFFNPPAPGIPSWSLLFLPFSIAAQIVFLIWQYRAARVARQLGYPARHSPGWGVAFWFIPVVQFWMPYQAVRDCLPPGHPTRKTVLPVWILVIVATATIPWLDFGSGYDRPLGVAVLVVLGVMEALVGFGAYRVVTAIGKEHRQAVAAPYRQPGV